MGATTGGRGGADPQKLDGPPTIYVAFWWGSGGDNRLRQTGYTLLNFFRRKAVIPQTKKLDPPTLKMWLRPCLACYHRRVRIARSCRTHRQSGLTMSSRLLILDGRRSFPRPPSSWEWRFPCGGEGRGRVHIPNGIPICSSAFA